MSSSNSYTDSEKETFATSKHIWDEVIHPEKAKRKPKENGSVDKSPAQECDEDEHVDAFLLSFQDFWM